MKHMSVKKAIVSTVVLAAASTMTAPLAHALMEAPDAQVNATSSSVARLMSWDPNKTTTNTDGVIKTSGASHSLCTGTLIAPDWVITAKHCVSDGRDSGYATFGTTHDGKRYVYKKVVRHAHAAGDPEIDLALIQLAEPVTGVQPAKLWDQALIEEPAPGTFYGWGFDDTKTAEHDTLPVGSVQIDTVPIIAVNSPHPDMTVYQIDFLNSKVIQGDSGGPVFANSNDSLYGVLSMRQINPTSSTSATTAGFFLPVVSYADWIRDTTGADITPTDGAETSPQTSPTEVDDQIDFPEDPSGTTATVSSDPTATDSQSPTRPSGTTSSNISDTATPSTTQPVVNTPVQHPVAPIVGSVPQGVNNGFTDGSENRVPTLVREDGGESVFVDDDKVGPEVNTGGAVEKKSLWEKILGLFE